METIDIITRDMHQLHGANKVTEKLIYGRDVFCSHGYDLRYVVSRDGFIDCKDYTTSSLGKELNTKRYKNKRKVIEILKKLPFYKSAYIQSKIVKNEIEANKTVLEHIKLLDQTSDIIIFQDPFTAIYCLNNGYTPKKSIFISHSDSDPLEQLLLSRPSLNGTETEMVLRSEFKKLFETVDRVVTISNSSKKYMLDTYGLDCPCIHNGIEDAQNESVMKESDKDQCIHIAIVASLQYRKGQDIAINALSLLNEEELRRIRLHLLGEGKDKSKLQKMAKDLKVDSSVIFHGAVMNVHDILRKMDAFLLPTRADTVPIAIIEAMRAGLPVFATIVGEIPYMIDGCGETVEANKESLTVFYRRMIEGNIDLFSYSKNGRSKFEKEYTLSSMIHHYADVFDHL